MTKDSNHNCRNENETRDHIEKYGCSVIMIEASDYNPSFAYSIGLWEKFKHPEIIALGLNLKTLQAIINDAAEIVKQGEKIEIGKNYDEIFENSGAKFIHVLPGYIENYFGYALDFYDLTELPAIQLTWTDRNEKYPWDPEFEEEFKFKQPLLDRNLDFKFREEKNLSIFTTRRWLEENKPILRVIHDYDGDWQFLTGDPYPEDIQVVALEQMTKRDTTLNENFDLEYGESAERDFIGDKWRRDFIELEEE